MLVSSMEAYLNHIIPNEFIYKTIRKGREITFDKVQIESSKVSFKEKLLEILPIISSSDIDWITLQKEKNDILNLYENRKNLIHFKTNAADDFERYFDTIDKMLDFNIPSAINSTIFIMNSAFNDFIELEEE
jgi:hypothetical protein